MGKTIRLLLAHLLVAAIVFGQGLSSVGGTVKDPSGAVLPAAKVQLINTETGALRSALYPGALCVFAGAARNLSSYG